MRNTKSSVYKKIAANKTSLKSQKVDLSLIDEIGSEYQRFQDAYDSASYLAYDWGDEIIDAYSDFRQQYNLDDYIVNGATTDLEEVTELMQGYFDTLEEKVNDLGIDPETILPSYYDLKQWLADAPSLLRDAKDKYREVVDYTGMPDFWN